MFSKKSAMRKTMIDIGIAEDLQISMLQERIHDILLQILQILDVSNAELSLYITTNEEIAKLNAEHRQIQKPTDILSWSYFDEDQQCLGELALSWDQTQIQAKQNEWCVETEVIRLLVHGCIHLLGYDHQTLEEEQTMLTLEKKVLAHFQLESIYPAFYS